MLSSIPPLQNDQEDVSYDIESLYINIPIEANYIIEQIYFHKKLEAICLKLIFKRLLIKLTAEITFNFNSIFFKHVDGAIFGRPLSVTCNDIYMAKMENNVVILFKPMFYRRIVDDIYNKQYVGGNGSFD